MSKIPKPGSSLLYRFFMFILVSVVAGVLVAGLFIPFAGMAGQLAGTVARGVESIPADLETPPQSEKSTVYLANGEVLAQFYDENRTYVPIDEIAPVMREAQVAIEDHRFYEHGALDARATMRALVRNTSSTGGTQGGSSITQQYVKMVQIETAAQRGDKEGVAKAQEQSLSRKIQELRYAIAVENRFVKDPNGGGKDAILERYLNIAYYGDGAYGVESAAHHYFNTTAKDLTLDQAALLAGMVQNPVATDPVNNPKAAMDRRNVVLNRMAELNLVTADEAAAAQQVTFDESKVQPNVNGCVSTRYPFLCDYVKRSIEKLPALGATAEERANTLKRGGLEIQTQIDPRTQDAAQRAIDDKLDPRDPVISTMVMIQPGTGQILAMAQNRPVMGNNVEAGETYYNYAVGGAQSEDDMGGAEGYQAGSTFKIFTAAAALEAGIPLGKSYDASQTVNFQGQTFKGCAGNFKSPNYQVSNSTGVSGQMDMHRATAYSVNTYFIMLERDAGICETARMAEKVGVKLASKGSLTGDYSDFPSFTLGTPEVTPISMAEAYATFAAGGIHCDPVVLQKVTTKAGQEIPLPNDTCKRVIDEKYANAVNDLLQGVMNGTGRPATIPGGYPQGGKTGTIDANQAVWFAGGTPEVTGVSMIAIDKTHPYWKSAQWTRGTPTLKNVTLPYSRYAMSGSGGGDAGQDIYRPSMTAALEGKPKTKFGAVDKTVREGVPVEVPNVSGMTPDQARAALEAAGFSVGTTTRFHNSRSGTYLGISASGAVPKGTMIYLVYSKGPEPKPEPTQQPSQSQSQQPADPQTSQQPQSQQPQTQEQQPPAEQPQTQEQQPPASQPPAEQPPTQEQPPAQEQPPTEGNPGNGGGNNGGGNGNGGGNNGTGNGEGNGG